MGGAVTERASTDARGRAAAGGVGSGSACSAGRSIRSTSGTSRSPRPPGASSGSIRCWSFRRRAAAQGRAGDGAGRGSPGDGRAGGRGRGRPGREPDRDRPAGAVVDGRHADGIAGRRGRVRPGRRPDADPLRRAFAGLPSWRDTARILGLARIAVAPRPGPRAAVAGRLAQRAAPALAAGTVILAGPQRRRLGDRHPPRVLRPAFRSSGLVAPTVARYIEVHHLYRQPSLSEEAT